MVPLLLGQVVEALALDEEVPSIDDFKDETWPSDLTPRAVEAIQAFKVRWPQGCCCGCGWRCCW